MGVKHRIDWQDEKSNNYRFDIVFVDYSSTIKEDYKLIDSTLKYDNRDKFKFTPIIPSEFNITLIFEDSNLFTEFINIEDDKVFGNLYKNNILIWKGAFINENTAQPFTNNKYFQINLRFIDNINKLKVIQYDNLILNRNLDQQITLMELIVKILNNVIEAEIDISNEIYYSNQNYKNIRSSFQYFYINYENYLGVNCYEVLEDILLSFGLSIKFKNGRWNISNFIESGQEVFYRYSYNGAFLQKIVNNQLNTIDNTSNYFEDGSINIEYERAYNSITINSDINKNTQIVRGGDFLNDAIWTSATNPTFFTPTNVNISKDNGLKMNSPSITDIFILPRPEPIAQAKASYIRSIAIPVMTLPLNLNDGLAFNKFIDLKINLQQVPIYTEPNKDVAGWDENFYIESKKQQLELFASDRFGQTYLGAKYEDSTGVYHLDFNASNIVNGDDRRSTWIQDNTLRFGDFQNINSSFVRKEISTNRDVYESTSINGPELFTSEGAEITQRIYLYKDVLGKTQNLLTSNGTITFYFSQCYHYRFVSKLGYGIPEMYKLTFTGIVNNFRSIDIVNSDDIEQVSYVGTINKKFNTQLDDINIQIDSFNGKRSSGTLLISNTSNSNIVIGDVIQYKNNSFTSGLSGILLNMFFLNYSQNSQIVSGNVFGNIDVNIFDRISWNNKIYCVTSVNKDLINSITEIEMKEIFN
ncbi:hypothetical protein P872_18520 [Rhodonellum psychrophilum GCM71 = DSM 17998]|uniref:Uncharacterized protein n=2 Tax=Rhodonellum TaxID=336827 RepID=U5C0G2_9BACT|nr:MULTISPECIES: hypothetical protein [Rhodonellum]ERM82391.1 hypothetical protein P872_18520 [Rhodonellum psychrophilum GCM71 = DSM 17998]SDZ35735.1 hypothetical protein SAMN05444412_11160 [Rhodonellum ikkaensis]